MEDEIFLFLEIINLKKSGKKCYIAFNVRILFII